MIKEVFELFDTDGEQQLDEEELALAIYTLGFSQSGHFQVSWLHMSVDICRILAINSKVMAFL